MVRFAVTCPTPTQPKQTKIGMQGKRQRLFILQKYPISPKSQKKSRQNEFLASFSKQMNRIDKYCIAFSCFLINFLHLLKNAFAFGFKRKCVLLKTQVRFESNASTF